MAKHRAPETQDELVGEELRAELHAIALRTYATQEKRRADEQVQAGNFTAAIQHTENHDAAWKCAQAWEWVRVAMWEIRNGRAA